MKTSDAKQGLFRALEQVVRADAVLATNTSSLSVSLIASACRHPERVAGFHFFNPVPLMKIVEVVRGELTDPQVIERLVTLAGHAGHFAATTPDSPGFLVNHAEGPSVRRHCGPGRGGLPPRRKSIASSRTALAFAWGRSNCRTWSASTSPMR